MPDPAFAALRGSELIGRPLGDSAFQNAIGRRLGRVVTPGKRQRKRKGEGRRVETKGKDGRVTVIRVTVILILGVTVIRVQPLLDRAPRFADLLDAAGDDPAFAALRGSELIGRPLGDSAFQNAIGRRLGRVVTPGKRGRKPKAEERVSKKRGKDGRVTVILVILLILIRNS